MSLLRSIIRLSILFAAPLSVRVAIWLGGLAYASSLSVYDVPVYQGMASQFLEFLSSGNFVEITTFYIKYQIPPYGILITSAMYSLSSLLMEPSKAILVPPIIFSSLTCVVIFLIGSRISTKIGLAAWAIAVLDPYQLQFSVAFLDSIMNFFLSLAIYYFIKSYKGTRGGILAMSLIFTLAILTKYTASVFLLLFVVLYAMVFRAPRKALLLLSITILLALLLNFQLWTAEGRQAYMDLALRASQPGTPTINTLRLPIVLGPIDIGVPLAYPWYFATYLGMGYIGFNVLPYLSHIALFGAIVYIAISRRHLSVDKRILLWATTAILSIFFLPRNYWTANWAEGFIQGALVKQFYPYYFTLTAPPVVLLLASLLLTSREKKLERISLLIVAPVIIFSSFAPLTSVFLMIFPYWEFIFTLIYNYNINPTYMPGLYAFIVTCLIAAYSIMFTIIVAKRLKRGGDAFPANGS